MIPVTELGCYFTYLNNTLVVVDPTTGEKSPIEGLPRITIRDHDLDGLPDDFNIEVGGKPLNKEELTEDGFIKFRNSSEHEAILMQ